MSMNHISSTVATSFHSTVSNPSPHHSFHTLFLLKIMPTQSHTSHHSWIDFTVFNADADTSCGQCSSCKSLSLTATIQDTLGLPNIPAVIPRNNVMVLSVSDVDIENFTLHISGLTYTEFSSEIVFEWKAVGLSNYGTQSIFSLIFKVVQIILEAISYTPSKKPEICVSWIEKVYINSNVINSCLCTKEVSLFLHSKAPSANHIYCRKIKSSSGNDTELLLFSVYPTWSSYGFTKKTYSWTQALHLCKSLNYTLPMMKDNRELHALMSWLKFSHVIHVEAFFAGLLQRHGKVRKA